MPVKKQAEKLNSPKKSKKQEQGKPEFESGTNKYKIDDEQVEKLAARFWHITEIAAFFNVDESTIRKRFPKILQKGKELGKAKLRDLQLKRALDGNVSMLIWLGKQYLDQREPLPEMKTMNTDELDQLRVIIYEKTKANI